MSRSFRKTPIFGYTCADSDKFDKQLANRRIRRTPAFEVPEIRQFQCMPTAKDGKQYVSGATKKEMAK